MCPWAAARPLAVRAASLRLGASSRSPARPCRHPRAPQPCPPAPFTPAGLRQPPIGRYLLCSAGVPGAFGPGRPPDLRPPRGLPARSPSAPRASLGASSRSPPVPSGPSGALHTSGACLLVAGSASFPPWPCGRPPAPQPGPPAPPAPSTPAALVSLCVASALTAHPLAISHAIPPRLFQTMNLWCWNCSVSEHC